MNTKKISVLNTASCFIFLFGSIPQTCYDEKFVILRSLKSLGSVDFPKPKEVQAPKNNITIFHKAD